MFRKEFWDKKGTYQDKVKELMSFYKGSLPGNKREYYDYTSYRFKKRSDATIKGITKAKEHLKDYCNNATIEAYFALGNTLIMRGGYNQAVDLNNKTTLSAAIWILDQLSIQGNIDKSYPYLPVITNPEDEQSVLLPYINHPMYDYQLIVSMVKLIRQRNTAKAFPDNKVGTLQWDSNKPDKNDISRQNRDAYDAVIKLIDPSAVAYATEKYEHDVWDFYRISFQIIDRIEEHVTNLEKELEEIETSSRNRMLGRNRSSVFADQSKSHSMEILDYTSVDNEQFNRIRLLHEEIDRLENITLTELSLVNDREKIGKKLSDIIPRSLLNELVHFHVDDPFESSFALLYLLDKGSNIPWFYYGSISVAYTMVDQLPYDARHLEMQKPVLLSDWNDALYEHRYEGYRWPELMDASGEPVKRSYANNLSQLIYSNSMSVFPRVIPGLSSVNDFLSELGELTDREREAYSLLLYSLHAESLRAQSLDGYRLESVINTQETIQNPEEPEQKSTSEPNLEEVIRLRNKNSRLVESIQDLLAQKRSIDEKVQLLSKVVKEQQTELVDLREKIFLFDHEDKQEESVDTAIEYPFYTEGKILSFGGHAAWLSDMKKKLPNVVFVSSETLPNVDLIRGADEVWIQTNCISHSDYYKIMDTLKIMGKQVRYYVHSGVNKCADQIVRSCRK